MILALARHIFEHGTDGRFYSQIRKYPHEGGKVYWSMASKTRRRRPSSIVATRPRPTRRGSQPARFRNGDTDQPFVRAAYSATASTCLALEAAT